jgi:hypothetical protein
MKVWPIILASSMFATATTAASAHTYLLSIRGISLTPDESVPSFKVTTWGIEIKAICRIPADWEITGGRTGPLGTIAGGAGHGSSELRSRDLRKLRGLALIELSEPIARHSHGNVPATFRGEVSVDVGRNSTKRTITLSLANIRLPKADACPSKS